MTKLVNPLLIAFGAAGGTYILVTPGEQVLIGLASGFALTWGIMGALRS